MPLRWLPMVLVGAVACTRRAPAPPVPSPALAQPPAVPAPELVDVSHVRELRGGWIATVANINWPSRPGLTSEAQRQELVALLDASAEAGLNAIFFQIRPEGDALYDSDLEPWSRYLTGTQGNDPGYDPLAFAIDAAHARGLELHAWFNPYRAGLNHRDRVSNDHVAVTMAEHVHKYGKHRWMDPGAPAVQDHTAAVVADVVARYDIDGVHFDDYFYPYPTKARFPDRATFAAHGNGRSLSDWRRANVDGMVARVSGVVTRAKPWVRFGISPFGIYRPGHPPGIEGFDQYAKLYADPPAWKANGLVDYLAPQLYWTTDSAKQPYEPLLAWWNDLPGEGYNVPGNFLAKLGNDDRYTVDEFRKQVALTRAAGAGNIWFHVGPLLDNEQGIRDVFADELYPTPALPPPVAALADRPVNPPTLEVEGNRVSVRHADARWWVVYADTDAGWAVDRIASAEEPALQLPDGRWAVAAAGRHGVESQGVVVRLGD